MAYLHQSDPFEPNFPPCRTGHVSVSYGKDIYIWGGYKINPGDTSHSYFGGNEIWIYNCITEKWRPKICMCESPPAMSGSAAIVIKDDMYLFGGYAYNGIGHSNHLYKLDLITLQWQQIKPVGTLPLAVDKVVGWNHNNKFYIFGGFGNFNHGPSYDFQFIFYSRSWKGWTNQCFEFDPEKQVWNKPVCTGTLPSPRAAHAVTVMHGKVYIFGGRHDMTRLNDLHCLNMETMQWSGEIPVKGPVPVGRTWHTLTAVHDEYLILYGGFSQHKTKLSDCWMFSIIKRTWQPLELPHQKPRVWHSANLTVFNEVLIYGGTKELSSESNQNSDILLIRISPKSLFRTCLDKLVKHPLFTLIWIKWLPCTVQHALRQRLSPTYRVMIRKT